LFFFIFFIILFFIFYQCTVEPTATLAAQPTTVQTNTNKSTLRKALRQESAGNELKRLRRKAALLT